MKSILCRILEDGNAKMELTISSERHSINLISMPMNRAFHRGFNTLLIDSQTIPRRDLPRLVSYSNITFRRVYSNRMDIFIRVIPKYPYLLGQQSIHDATNIHSPSEIRRTNTLRASKTHNGKHRLIRHHQPISVMGRLESQNASPESMLRCDGFVVGEVECDEGGACGL